MSSTSGTVSTFRYVPTYESYIERASSQAAAGTAVLNRALLTYQSSTAYIRAPLVLREGQLLSAIERSDPLGLTQSQISAPVGYTTANFRVQIDESGAQTLCRASSSEGGGSGRCASCMCNVPSSVPNAIYGNDSFIVSCVQGEVWGTYQEVELPNFIEPTSFGSDSMMQSNIFLGSVMYARVNLGTGTMCMFHHEIVGVPLGYQSLKVGFNTPFLQNLGNYFEEGSGKYCNFFVQCHNSNELYQVSAPTVEFQATEKNAHLNVSISAKSSTASLFWTLFCFALPPFWQKRKKYIHKKRQSELKLIDNIIHIRAGLCLEEKYLEKLKKTKEEQIEATILTEKALLPKGWEWVLTDPIWKVPGMQWCMGYVKSRQKKHEIQRLSRTQKRLSRQEPNPSLIIKGATDSNDRGLISMAVPYLDLDDPRGGSRMALTEDALLMGGLAKGPDIIVDNEAQTIKIIVGPNSDSVMQIIEINKQEISIRTLKVKPKVHAEERLKRIVDRKWELKDECSKIVLRDNKIEMVYQGNDPNPSEMISIKFTDTQLQIRSDHKIEIDGKTSVTLDAKGGIEMKGNPVTINGNSVEAL